jgi:hypothetical protein
MILPRHFETRLGQPKIVVVRHILPMTGADAKRNFSRSRPLDGYNIEFVSIFGRADTEKCRNRIAGCFLPSNEKLMGG